MVPPEALHNNEPEMTLFPFSTLTFRSDFDSLVSNRDVAYRCGAIRRDEDQRFKSDSQFIINFQFELSKTQNYYKIYVTRIRVHFKHIIGHRILPFSHYMKHGPGR